MQDALRSAYRIRVLRYAAVGAGNTALSFAVFTALVFAGLAAVPASALAFLAGAAHGYVVNRAWTFAASDGLRPRVSYLGVQSVAVALTLGLVAGWVEAGAPKLLAEALALPPVTVLTFVCNRRWAFRNARSSGIPRGASPLRPAEVGLTRGSALPLRPLPFADTDRFVA
jgi:putative flippase GtrA